MSSDHKRVSKTTHLAVKTIVPIFIYFCLVTACNRPMLQPPATQTTVMELHGLPPTPMAPATLQTLRNTPTANSPQAAASTTHRANDSPASTPARTPQHTSTPYHTPAWCPVKTVIPVLSGKLRVVYASQSGLWSWDEGGTRRQLNKAGDIQQVSISDDGQVVAFSRHLDEHHAELWAINADGSNERRLVSADELARLDGSKDALGIFPTLIQWEPGTHHFTFFTYPLYDGIWIFEPSVPWLVDVTAGSVSAAPYQGGYILYAPDGKHVAIYSTGGLSTARIDGSDLRENILPGYHGIGEGESYYDPRPVWASDSSSLTVALPDEDDMYNSNGTVTVWRVPVDGMPGAIGQWRAFAPSVQFIPDLGSMAYWPWPEGTANQRELHLARSDGDLNNNAADAIYMRGDSINFLAWSPDSQHFLFEMVSPASGNQIYLGNICMRPKLIIEGESLRTAAWAVAPVVWVDASRFLLEINRPGFDDRGELRLGRLGQELMDTLGVVIAYDWAILP